MAQYFRVQRPNFQDYVVEPPEYLTDQQAATRGESAGGILGDVKILPVDRPAYEQIIQPYEERINNITQHLQQNPQDKDRLQPRIDQLRRELYSEYRTGQLANLRNRYEAFQQNVQEPLSNIKDPYLREQYKQRVRLPSYEQDPTGQAIGLTDEPLATAPTRKESMALTKQLYENIKPDATEYAFNKLAETSGEVLGGIEETRKFVQDNVNEYLYSAIPGPQRQFIVQEQGEPFYDTETGEFNTDTPYGYQLDLMAKQLAKDVTETKEFRELSKDTSGGGAAGAMSTDQVVRKIATLNSRPESYVGGSNNLPYLQNAENKQEVLNRLGLTEQQINMGVQADDFLFNQSPTGSRSMNAPRYKDIVWVKGQPKVLIEKTFDKGYGMGEGIRYEVKNLTLEDILNNYSSQGKKNEVVAELERRGWIDSDGNLNVDKMRNDLPPQKIDME